MSDVNPDRVALFRFIENPEPVAIASNPMLEALDARLEAYTAEQHLVEMSFRPPPFWRQGGGGVQGGSVSVMLDFLLAFTAMAAIGVEANVTSLDLNTSFLGRIGDGDVIGRGWTEKAGRRVVYARGELIENGKTRATASSTLLVVKGGAAISS